uniref:Saposin B-type domain-containing protein n=1 Tax=Steinernema glaseri TaxID=37863 RepID=A0A1I7Y7G6_9BILA
MKCLLALFLLLAVVATVNGIPMRPVPCDIDAVVTYNKFMAATRASMPDGPLKSAFQCMFACVNGELQCI